MQSTNWKSLEMTKTFLKSSKNPKFLILYSVKNMFHYKKSEHTYTFLMLLDDKQLLINIKLDRSIY